MYVHMKILPAFILLNIALASACHDGKYVETYARIVERRDIDGGKLQLNYIFKVGQTTIAGSKKINNQSIPRDSVRIKYNAQNPLENDLILND